jgi:hypothetical protein
MYVPKRKNLKWISPHFFSLVGRRPHQNIIIMGDKVRPSRRSVFPPFGVVAFSGRRSSGMRGV